MFVALYLSLSHVHLLLRNQLGHLNIYQIHLAIQKRRYTDINHKMIYISRVYI